MAGADGTCPTCDGPVSKNKAGRPKKFCSLRCHNGKDNLGIRESGPGYCLVCDVPISAKTTGRYNKFCSKECRYLNTYKHLVKEWKCETCYKPIEGRRKRFCNKKCRINFKVEKACSCCGTIIFSRLKQNKGRKGLCKYCAGKVAAKAHAKIAEELRPQRKEAARAKYEAKLAELRASRVPKPIEQRICKQCSSLFSVNSGSARHVCSVRCRQISYAWDRQKNLKEVTCGCCGSSFCPLYAGPVAKPIAYCSDECRTKKQREVRNAYEAKRRALMKTTVANTVYRFKVFARDGWVCQACHCHSPRSLNGTHDPRAPELDHIVALSKGGEHTYVNCQLLCRSCNQAKSNKGWSEFLLGRASFGQPLTADTIIYGAAWFKSLNRNKGLGAVSTLGNDLF